MSKKKRHQLSRLGATLCFQYSVFERMWAQREKDPMVQKGVRLSHFNHLLALNRNLGVAQMSFNEEPKAVKAQYTEIYRRWEGLRD